MPRGHLTSSADFKTFVNAQYLTTITYDSFESRLLESPFASNCRHYDREGLNSRSQCRHDCFKSHIIAKSGRTPHDVKETETIPPNINVFEEDDLSSIESDQNKISLIQEHCHQQCHQRECHSVRFVHRVLKEQANPAPTKTTVIGTAAPRSPVIRTEEQPSIPFISFLTNLFSTFGFWLGLSVAGSLSAFKMVKIKFYKYGQERVVRETSHRRDNRVTPGVPLFIRIQGLRSAQSSTSLLPGSIDSRRRKSVSLNRGGPLQILSDIDS